MNPNQNELIFPLNVPLVAQPDTVCNSSSWKTIAHFTSTVLILTSIKEKQEKTNLKAIQVTGYGFSSSLLSLGFRF